MTQAIMTEATRRPELDDLTRLIRLLDRQAPEVLLDLLDRLEPDP